MKAEIGFIFDEDLTARRRLKLVINAQSQTEATALHEFALRTGRWFDDCASQVTIEEPEGPKAEPEKAG